jgi:hypothetical protein
MNTYKNESIDVVCIRCPEHSHTTKTAQLVEGCICDECYAGPAGGPCEDIDECAANDGRGPCSDLCINTDGGYECDCSIPGYVPHPVNRHICISKLL